MTDNPQGRGFWYNRDSDFSRVRDPDRSQMAELCESEVSGLHRRVDLAMTFKRLDHQLLNVSWLIKLRNVLATFQSVLATCEKD